MARGAVRCGMAVAQEEVVTVECHEIDRGQVVRVKYGGDASRGWCVRS